MKYTMSCKEVEEETMANQHGQGRLQGEDGHDARNTEALNQHDN